MEITFLNQEYLWLFVGIPLLIILHFYSLRYVHNRALKFANFEALKRVTGGMILSRNIFLLLLRLTALLFLILSLAGATFWYKGSSDVSNYVLAIDNSGSMLANDFEPNRLEAAKEAALAFVKNLKSDSQIGVVSFSGTSFIESALTNSRTKTEQAISGIDVSSLHGTAISDAIKTSTNVLSGSDKSGIIILLTDGQENIASKDELNKIIDFINSKQATVNTIGIGTEAGGSLPGLSTLSTVDEETLKSIANLTGGKYIHSENKDALIKAYQSLDYESTESKIPIYLRLPFILLSMLILFVEWTLVNTKYRTIP